MSVVGVETGESLTAMELSELTHAEAAIERGLASFVEVGEALARVRDGRLYRDRHGTFEAYCRDRWGLPRTRAYDIISAAETASAVSEISDTPPANEGQAKALRGLPPEQAAETMRAASDATGGRVTAAAIAAARQDRDDERSAPQSASGGETGPDASASDYPAPAEARPQNTPPTIPQGEPVSRAVGGASAPVSPSPPTGGDTGPTPTPAPAPVKSRRRPLPDAFWTALHDLSRQAETLHRLTQDGRWPTNAEQLATGRNRNELHRIDDLIHQVINSLPAQEPTP